jgi:peroxiredoxin
MSTTNASTSASTLTPRTDPPGPRPGESFPDLVLPDHNGNARRLSDLAGDDPLLVNFYRGFWCPKEQVFFRRVLAPLHEEAEVAYTRFVSVSVDPPPVEAAFRAGIGARWTFLSDEDCRYQAELDLRETTDTNHRPYVPCAFTLRPDLTVVGAWHGYWFWGRPTAEELRASFRGITREIRPDWIVPR